MLPPNLAADLCRRSMLQSIPLGIVAWEFLQCIGLQDIQSCWQSSGLASKRSPPFSTSTLPLGKRKPSSPHLIAHRWQTVSMWRPAGWYWLRATRRGGCGRSCLKRASSCYPSNLPWASASNTHRLWPFPPPSSPDRQAPVVLSARIPGRLELMVNRAFYEVAGGQWILPKFQILGPSAAGAD